MIQMKIMLLTIVVGNGVTRCKSSIKLKKKFLKQKIFRSVKRSQNFLDTSRIYIWKGSDCPRTFKKELIVTFYVLNNIFSYILVVFVFFFREIFMAISNLFSPFIFFFFRKILISLTCFFLWSFFVFLIIFIYHFYKYTKKLFWNIFFYKLWTLYMSYVHEICN